MGNQSEQLKVVREAIGAFRDTFPPSIFDPKNPIVRLHEPTYGTDEIFAVTEKLLLDRITMGEAVRAFEQTFSDYGRYAESVSVNSGSSANLLAIAALVNPEMDNPMKPGDEVIVSALSWATTVWPLVQFGLVPVIVDIDPLTLNLDPNEVEKAIGPKTKAVMPVHVYGNPCDMDALCSICESHNLYLIEDCCEALGAEYNGKAVGKFGHIGTFSFYFSHHATTLEGGMCVTENFQLSELCRILRAHGWTRDCKDKAGQQARFPEIDPKFLFVNSGFNLRISEPQGAMGTIQVKKLEGFVSKRRENANYWRNALSNHAAWLHLQTEQNKGKNSWFGIPITVDASAPFTAMEIRDALENNGIETRSIICGNIARQPGMKLFEHRVCGDMSHANHIMGAGFSFGNHQAIGPDALNHIQSVINNFLAKY
ncbi:MAG: DegT/DnrJ/EryC1/StrS family aminotransferase [Rhodospirillales bacterium]|nr:DegT/DnrJ/EryC1/StrS family aminotransferase [Rhodospirillales bacterium]